jgi:hypothetical protein
MKKSPYLIIDLKTNYWLRKGLTKFVGLFQKYLDMIKDVLGYLSILINLIILASYDDLGSDRIDDPDLFDIGTTNTIVILTVLGCISALMLAIIFVLWVVNIVPLLYKEFQIQEEIDEKRSKEVGNTNQFNVVFEPLSKLNALLYLFYNVLTNYKLVYYTSMLVLAILGITFHPFFYSGLLTCFVSRRSALIDVLQAVVIPMNSLLQTIMLMFMVAYVFTVYSYTYYSKYYNTNECYSLWTCYVISFDQTFKNDGALGGFFGGDYEDLGTIVHVDYDRVAYDNLFFLIVGILLIEIISGLIIDTFGELRQKRNEITEDCDNVCFV